MNLPNFMIIGAARSGTTALYRTLQGHPQVYLCPIKEPNFFAYEGQGQAAERRGAIANACITSLEEYASLFDSVAGELAIGEASPSYLISPGAPRRIRALIPDARLIVILRNPVERAYSAHLMKSIYGGAERESWGNAVRDIYWGFYYTHLRRYYDTFDCGQLRVYLHEDLRAGPGAVLDDLSAFLGIDRAALPDLVAESNVSGVARNGAWRGFLVRLQHLGSGLKPLLPIAWHPALAGAVSGLRRRGLKKAPPLDPAVRAELVEIFRADVTRLQDLIGRDLQAWLQ